jgi:hypothetical protein
MSEVVRKLQNVGLVVAAYAAIGLGLGVVGSQHLAAGDLVTAEVASSLGTTDAMVTGVVSFFQFERFVGAATVVIAAGVGGIVGVRVGDIDVAALGSLVGYPVMLLCAGALVATLVPDIAGLGRPTPFVLFQSPVPELGATAVVSGVVSGAIALSVVVLQP